MSMSGRVQPATAHQAGLRTASSEPAVRRGVPEPVRVEPVDAGGLGAQPKRLVPRVVGEPLPAVPEPQVGRLSEAMDAAKPAIAVDRQRRLRANRRQPALAALARRAVSIPPTRSMSPTWSSTTSPARRPVSSIARTMASSRRCRMASLGSAPFGGEHALMSARSWSSDSGSMTFSSSLG